MILVVVMSILAVGTVSNVLRLNNTNSRLRAQAMNGQHALNRQCALVPITAKVYADAVSRRVITAREFGRIVGSAAAICPEHP